MRILHVSEVLPGGVGSYIDDLAAAQADRLGRDRIMVLGPASQLDVLARRGGYRVRGYPQDRRGRHGLWALRAALRAVVADFAPDVVHLHSSFAGAIGRLPGACGPAGPRPALVYTAHGWSIDPDRAGGVRARLLIALERVLANRCDRIVNISPHETAFLTSMGFPAERMSVVPTGLPPCAPSTEPGDRANSPIRLLFAGRLDRQKGLDLIWPEICGTAAAGYRLRVAGAPGAAENDRYRNAPPHVEMLGWVERDRVAREITECDALLMPSRWEGLPIIALEAMRAGKPVIANRVGPFPYMIDHGVDGLVADFFRPGELARVLAGVDGAALAAMGRRARARFAQCYRQDRMVDTLFAVYRAAVSAASTNLDSRAADRSQE